MYHPFFNEKDLTDDEIIEKTNQLHLQLNHAESYGQNQMAESIRLMILTLQEEQQDRFHMLEEDRLKKEKIDTTETITLGKLATDDDDGK